ncbi:hypothetical protein PUNSTDRAFT_98561 [Punctularia strigosozonata HHB-11173 SS5]|uniref:uncharacterized protein n=1 Tax=Punctularia strigosozonata (strain HHB-11173) TaxID=741275 RepID=UPI0004417E03|nr:uncharacterized protein PUNSTDRAFT_98561 [Punctularia strigosozonata HHB-11173 SS5]EIN11451.1 hypothetical protein PUNSTDRAFT_98561 [Punctularia strigosozonata HHB-11173 SS5]
MPSYTEKNPERVAAGLKAAIHNPRVTEEAKDRAAQELEDMGYEAPQELSSRASVGGNDDGLDEHTHRVLGGFKASLKNPNVSEEAKEHAADVLEAADEDPASIHEHRVLGGYKATLKNPNVSKQAKQQARELLVENGVDA